MKRIIVLFVLVTAGLITSCEGPQGPPGIPGYSAESEVFELLNVNFIYNQEIGYSIYQQFTPPILDSDVVLIYRLSGTINAQTPIWQLIPRTLYLPQGELDYDYDFSIVDFTIYAGGSYDLAFTPSYLQNQTFRIVIIPGYFTNKSANRVDFSDYNKVIQYYNIDDSNIKVLNR